MADTGEWVTLKAAAEALGISIDATRRRVRHQALKGQRRRTAQGWRWAVWLPDDDAVRAAIAGTTERIFGPDLAAGGDVAAPGGTVAAPGGGHVARSGDGPPPGATYPPPGATSRDLVGSRAAEMAVYTERLLAPYVRRIEEQAEEIGRLKAELEASRAAHSRPAPARAWWRFW